MRDYAQTFGDRVRFVPLKVIESCAAAVPALATETERLMLISVYSGDRPLFSGTAGKDEQGHLVLRPS
jgi:hypothetical protein